MMLSGGLAQDTNFTLISLKHTLIADFIYCFRFLSCVAWFVSRFVFEKCTLGGPASSFQPAFSIAWPLRLDLCDIVSIQCRLNSSSSFHQVECLA